MLSASSSLLGLQAQAPVLHSEPVRPEAGVVAHLYARLMLLGRFLRALGRWWMEADFRSRQAPLLVVALGIWGLTAQAAWRSQESGTPLLTQSISKITLGKTRAAINAGITPPRPAAKAESAPAAPVSNLANVRPVSPADVQESAQKPSGSFPTLLAASLRSWFSAEPASAEKVHGNPRRRVWVDMKTGLYYCPGAAYYGFGGRSRGKVMPQKDAEYEYFQPATGAPCR